MSNIIYNCAFTQVVTGIFIMGAIHVRSI